MILSPSLVLNLDYSAGKYRRGTTGAQRSKSSSTNQLNKKVHFTVVSSGRRSDRRHVLNVSVSGFIDHLQWYSSTFPGTLEFEFIDFVSDLCSISLWYNKIGRYCLFCFLDFDFLDIFFNVVSE